MSLGGALTSSDTSVMIRSEMVGTGLGRVSLVKFFNDFVSMGEIGGCGPLKFFVSAFVAHPSDVVEQFTC
jgi:hypothetical protein